MKKLTITINIEKHGDNAHATMDIVDENNSHDFGLCGIHWLAVARALSHFAMDSMDKAATAIQADDLQKLGTITLKPSDELEGGQE